MKIWGVTVTFTYIQPRVLDHTGNKQRNKQRANYAHCHLSTKSVEQTVREKKSSVKI